MRPLTCCKRVEGSPTARLTLEQNRAVQGCADTTGNLVDQLQLGRFESVADLDSGSSCIEPRTPSAPTSGTVTTLRIADLFQHVTTWHAWNTAGSMSAISSRSPVLITPRRAQESVGVVREVTLDLLGELDHFAGSR